MKFKTVKSGYDPVEVEEYIKRLRDVYDKTLVAQRDRIFEQRESLEKSEAAIAAFEKDKGIINKSIESAVAKAEDIKSMAKSKYAAEIASLREFHEVWVSYYARIREKYPLDDEIENIGAINEKIDSVLGDADSFAPRGKSGFDPVSLIEMHLAAEETDGTAFDYNEAQNPQDDIHSILGDLGIMFDEK